MKNIVLLLFLTPFVLYSQSIEEENDTIPYHPFGDYQEIICSKVSVSSQAVVRYESSTIVYLKLESDENINNYNLNVKVNRLSINNPKLTMDCELILESLAPNSVIDITYTDGCGNDASLIRVTTGSPFVSEGLVVSKALMKAVKQLYVGRETNVARFFENEKTLHYYEKLAFYQNTILKGSAISDMQHYGYFPDAAIANSSRGTCSCAVLLTHSDFAPGANNDQFPISTPIITGNAYSTGFISSDNEETQQNWSGNSNEGYFAHNVYSKGAARHQDTWANGRRIKTRGATKTVGGESISPNYSYVGISWFCYDGNYISSCNCSKRINYSALYNTRLRTTMSLPACFLCGSKSGKSKAEDWVILVLTNEDGINNVLASSRATVETERGKYFNVDFIINIVELIGTIAPILMAGDAAAVVAEPLIDEIVDDVTALIQTPLFLVSGTTDKDNNMALINQEGTFQITPNVVWYLKMFSFGRTEVEGATSWNGAARIVSAFRLGVSIRAGIDSGQPSTCCTLGGSC